MSVPPISEGRRRASGVGPVGVSSLDDKSGLPHAPTCDMVDTTTGGINQMSSSDRHETSLYEPDNMSSGYFCMSFGLFNPQRVPYCVQ